MGGNMRLRNKETGEITEATITVCKWTSDYEDLLTEAEYENISDVMRDWEDYKPKEPLIKDEKIRKAVRAWARTNEVKEVMFDKYWHSFRDADMAISFLFSFRDFDCLEDGKTYTIAELCGEEEEMTKDILELRAEFIDRFGDADLFDEFYAILVKKVQENWPEIERRLVEMHEEDKEDAKYRKKIVK